MSTYSLYIHIPFCIKKCDYCDFTSFAGMDHFITQYVFALKAEIKTYSQGLNTPRLKSVYFGGGTPSILPEETVDEILNAVRDSFPLEEKAEISMEVNPGTVNLAKLSSYRASGVNRLSIGAQSFDDRELSRLGRVHTAGQISYTFNSARSAGFNNINLDLIFALPSQDIVSWSNNLKKALSFRPEHLSTYNLVLEEGTPLFAKKNSLELPSEDEECKMFKEAIGLLTASGYDHYEISNFATSGHKCLNNLTYWNNEEYIGVGAGATSYIEPSRYSNPKDIGSYITLWDNPDNSVLEARYRANIQTKDQQFSETMFLGLRLTEGVDLRSLKQKFGENIVNKYKDEIADLIKEGLLSLDGFRLRLTQRGLFLANEVFEKFV